MDFLEIEKIILQDDTRGMSSLYELINKGFIERSADLLLNTKGKIFICSGFYILKSKSPETDGPPGAISLGKTLEALDNEVYYVTDKYSKSIFEGMSDRNKVLEFPITSHAESNKIANDLIQIYNPQLVVSIERAGLSSDGKYRNFRGVDFSDYNAKIDYLFIDEFVQECKNVKQKVELRKHHGYGHSYYFIQTFIKDHFDFHSKILIK